MSSNSGKWINCLKVLGFFISPKLIKFNHKYIIRIFISILCWWSITPFVSCTLSQVIHKIYILIKTYYISMQVWLRKYSLRSMVICKTTTQTRYIYLYSILEFMIFILEPCHKNLFSVSFWSSNLSKSWPEFWKH